MYRRLRIDTRHAGENRYVSRSRYIGAPLLDMYGETHVLSKVTDYEILHEMALPGKLVSARLQDGNIRLTQTSIVRIIFKNSKPFVFTCSQKGDILLQRNLINYEL